MFNLTKSEGAKFFHSRKEGCSPSLSLLISIDLSKVSVTPLSQELLLFKVLQLNRKQR
jgi:hypothetical protein